MSRTANVHATGSSLYVPSTVIVGGHREIVRLLLEAGSDPDQRNGAGETPLERCFRVLEEEMGSVEGEVEPLSMHGWGFSAADRADVLRRLMHVVRELLMAGCDVRIRDNSRNNPGDYEVEVEEDTVRSDLDGTLKFVENIVKVCEAINALGEEGERLHCLYQDMLLLFYECVYISGRYFSWDELEAALLCHHDMDEAFREKMLAIGYRDFSLARSCRVVIRQSLRKPLRKNVQTLKVPKDVKQFILFSDLDY